jgi:phosphoglucosamine mutase
MGRKFFGTDGVRGTANTEPMTATTCLALASAAGAYFRRGDHRHRVVIGKDTRLSGYMLEPAMTAGFVSMGMDVMLVGPLPTPAIAMLVPALRADVGVVLSASHNPFHDNGIKLFGPDGYKLSDDIELEIEALIDKDLSDQLVAPEKLGRATRLEDAPGRYIEAVKRSFPDRLRLNDLKIVVDCANGAAYKVAPTVLFELGATVIPIGVSPDGFNINRNCGATAPDDLCAQVVAHGADVGIALDGDADRLVMVDETGTIIDGDQLMALIASSWREDGLLKGDGVVATIMSNLGLERFLKSYNLGLIRTKVGDRYVVEHMRMHGFNVGGEQSGHIVLSDYGTTGDGLVAALQVLGELVSSGRRASEIARLFEPVPQLLKNVRYDKGNGASPLDMDSVKKAIAAAEGRLADSGRLVIRPSGTEPLIRVMAEGDDEVLVGQVVDDLVDIISRATA